MNQIKEMNLRRLMDSCCVTISDDYYDELFDYLLDLDLNVVNIDDIVVNQIQYLDNDDLDEDDYYILKRDENGAYII